MAKKTPGQILKEKLEAEGDAIRKAMADAEIAQKTKAAAEVVEDIVEDIAEEILDDSNALMKKVKAFLPSRESAFHVIKIIAYWEVAKLALAFIL